MKSGRLEAIDVLDALYKYVHEKKDEGYQLRGWDGITYILTKYGDKYTVESAFGFRKFTSDEIDYAYVPDNNEMIKFYLQGGEVVNLELVRVIRFKNINVKIREILSD